jgi:hypothetical protein
MEKFPYWNIRMKTGFVLLFRMILWDAILSLGDLSVPLALYLMMVLPLSVLLLVLVTTWFACTNCRMESGRRKRRNVLLMQVCRVAEMESLEIYIP